jgi:peptidyl-prolyl cis-trans isomerase D
VKVEVEALAWGDLEPKIMQSLAAGAPPEVSHGQPITCTALQSKGLLLPLDDVVKALGENNIWDQVKRVCRVGDRQFGLVHAAGTSLLIYRKDLAQKLGLKARTIDAVDRQGRDPDGKPIPDLPGGVDVIANAFTSDVGVENEPVQTAGGGYLWFEVLGVKPSRERTLDEVRPLVEERWRADQIAAQLKAKANEIVDKVKAGTSLNDVASAAGLNVQTTFGIKRAGNAASMPPAVVSAVFATPKDGAGSAEGASPAEWIVFRVTDVKVPPADPNSEDMKKLKDQLVRGLADEQLALYVAKLEKDIGTSINEEGFAQVTGAASN